MVKKLTGYIYSIKNKVNGKLYVGRTNNYQRRYNEHFGKKDTCTILRKAFEKYGKDNFVMKPIVSFTTYNRQILDDVLNALEKYYIEKFDTYKNGYNATLGGEGNSGWEVSEETRKKRSQSLKGRKVSDKERERLLSYVKNRVWTKEQREHQKNIMLNRDPSIQKKIADKLRGRKRDKDLIMKAAAKRRKPILQYSLNGVFLKEHDGAICLGEQKEANIIACCKGKIASAYGYIWKYKTSNVYPIKIQAPKNYHVSNRPIIQFDKQNNVIKEYESATKAAIETSVGRKAIINCLGGRSKSAGGFVWKYKELRKEAVNE